MRYITILILFFTSQLLNGQCFPDRHNTSWYNSWTSCETAPNPNPIRGNSHWLHYDLGHDYVLSTSQIWNSNQPDSLSNGIQQVVIDYSLDGITWEEWGLHTIGMATGDKYYEGEIGPDFGGISARFVLITALSNHGGFCYSLGELKINVEATICQQSVPLNSGWNLISFDISPDDKSISSVTNSLQTDNLEFVTGFNNGAQIFNPNDPPFLNTLQEFEDGFGYWIKVQNDDVLNISGTCIANDFRKPFDAGWNLAAFPPDDPSSPTAYFSNEIADNNLEFITGFENGALTFNPNNPPFLNSLTELKNGLGYWVKMQNAIAGKNEEGINQSNVFSFLNGTSNLPKGEKINIQTSNGNNIGEILVLDDGYLMTTVIYGDDASTDFIEGISIGEKLVFLWNEQTLDINITFKGDLGLEKINLIFDNTQVNDLLANNIQVNAYPNPAKNQLFIDVYLPYETKELVFTIYDIQGSILLQSNESSLVKGNNLLEKNIQTFPNGVYFYKVQTEKMLATGMFNKN